MGVVQVVAEPVSVAAAVVGVLVLAVVVLIV